MSTRVNREFVYLEMCKVISGLSTCARRHVGCMITDKVGRILGIGYNGVATGIPHCIDEPCPGVAYPSGKGLDECVAIHAEMNALLQVSERENMHTLYSTSGICKQCIKILSNTSIMHIIYMTIYPGDRTTRKYWMDSKVNRIIRQVLVP